MRLSHPDASVAVRLSGYGYAEHWSTSEQIEPTANGNRVEYRRGNLTEWYENNASGLEQGFTLAKRPGEARDGEPLVFALAVQGELRPVLSPDGDAVLLQSNGQTVLRYGGLRAWDARGRTIPSRLEVRESQIRLIVEDAMRSIRWWWIRPGSTSKN